LETCLFAALSLEAIHVYLDDRAAGRYRLRTAALFGLAALSRPEGYLLFALSLADFIICAPRPKPDVARLTFYAVRLVYPGVVFSVIVLPYLLFSLRTSGHLLPNTYHAKAVVGLLPDKDFLSVAARYLILDNPILLPFYLLGLIGSTFPALSATKHPAPVVSLWSAGLPLGYALIHAELYQHGRYLMPLIPINAVIGVVGLLEFLALARRRGWGRWRESPSPMNIGVVLLIVAGTAWRLPTMAFQYARNVDEINRMHVAVGHWAAEYTPPDAVLALNDIGAITYISERPVVDLAGLVTPEVTPLLHSPDRAAGLIALMVERGVSYVVVFPTWFPDLAAREDVLEEVYRVTLTERTIAGGETMVAYRFNAPAGEDGTGGVK
jgi:hypothetical protein